MSSLYLRFALAWLVSVGVGCTSAPVRYYTLTPTLGKTRPASEATLQIDVRVVHIPPELNRAELIVRTGPTETTLLDNERWVSPMKDEIKDAVRLELQRRLDGTTGLPPSFTKLALDIDVQRLEAELGRYALLEASWSANSIGLPVRRSNGARVPPVRSEADERDRGMPAMQGSSRGINERSRRSPTPSSPC